MIIKTYDIETLAEKHTISRLESVIFTRRFYKTGSFEITATSNIFELGDIIAFKAFDEIRSGIVMKIVENIKGYSVLGFDIKGISGFRYITTPKTYSNTPCGILKSLATDFFTSGQRAVPNFQIDSSNITGQTTTLTTERGFLEKAIDEFSLKNELGISIDFDLQNIVFKVLKGADKSALVKFGRYNHSIEDYTHTKDNFNTYNVGYSLDQNGNITENGNASGLMRRECFKEKNISEYLSEKAPIETLRAESGEAYKYGSDYKLGDYVTVETQEYQTVKQITEIKEVYEPSRVIITPIFGTEKENPLKKILKGA